ncbi:MAG: DNA (cytosine-5-)-methyltransferase [Alphaproteobacteria bacterium]|nr:DNA (cytosine-5-)-methyltransferase [Alphaproteobacteria bacterium]
MKKAGTTIIKTGIIKYFASEIDKHAIKVAKTNYPNTIHIGNILDVKASSLPKIDLLIGGPCCQSFSFAGKRLGFQDERGKLFFEYIRLLEECRPKYFLMENVVMKKEHEKAISGLVGVEPIMINSALVSAQTRKRLYWLNIPNVTTPEDKNITWGDVRDRGVNAEKYYYGEKAMQWIARHSQRKNKTLTVHQDEDKMQMLEAGTCKKYSSQRFFGIPDLPSDEQAVASMRGRYLINGKRQDGKMKVAGLTKQYVEFRYDGKTNALSTVGKDNIVVPFTLPDRIPVDEFFFRYLTPEECEKLQTVPVGYTASVSDTQRYKMLGNGWTVDVIAHLLKGLNPDQL